MELYIFQVNEVWEFIFKIFTGLLASFIFLYLMLTIYKPKLRISEWICHRDEMLEFEDENGKKTKKNSKVFVFKVVNKSRFNAYDCRFHLYVRTPYMIDDNKVNHRLEPIKLRRDYIPFIPKYNKEKGIAGHAILVATLHDISKDIDERNLDYELSVIAKHGLSNLTHASFKRFKSSKKIKENAEFKFGKSLEIHEE